MKHLMMHVGLGKNGSTAIQLALEKIPQTLHNGPSYPRSPTGKSLLGDYILNYINDCDGEATSPINEVLTQLFPASGVSIISFESIGHTTDSAKFQLLSVLVDYFDMVDIIAYVRDPLEWNCKVYAQLHLDLPLSQLYDQPYLETQSGLLRIFREFSKSFSNVNLKVFSYEDACLQSGGLLGHFASVVTSCNRSAEFSACFENHPSSGFRANPKLTVNQYILAARLRDLTGTANVDLAGSKLGCDESGIVNGNSRSARLLFPPSQLESIYVTSQYDAILLKNYYQIEFLGINVLHDQLNSDVSLLRTLYESFINCARSEDCIRLFNQW